MPDTPPAETLRSAAKLMREKADLMWLSTIATLSDHELRMLNDLGVLSQRDRDLLSQVRPGWF